MSAWVPLFQTVVWAALIGGVLWGGRKLWSRLLEALGRRISEGDDVTLAGPGGVRAEFKRETRGMPRLQPGNQEVPAIAASDTATDLLAMREAQGKDQRSVHLVHVVAPSSEPGQRYDISAYLHGWNRERFDLPSDLSDVVRAEFCVGPMFSPSSVTVENHGERIGFVTSAYAPTLCVCRVTFRDGVQTVLSRYLDFESGDLAAAAQ